MLWGCGTGRCGTASLAKQLGGVHEPGSLQVMPYVMGKPASPGLFLEIRHRRDLDTPIVVDPRHSYVIPLIKEVDPEARFLWIYRDPVACVRSWLARGNWREPTWVAATGEVGTGWLNTGDLATYTDEGDPLGGRYHPRGGYPEGWTRVQKGAWFYRAVNSLIRDNLHEGYQVLKCPDDLTEHVNCNTEETWKAGQKLMNQDMRLIDETCGFLLAELDLLRETTRGVVL